MVYPTACVRPGVAEDWLQYFPAPQDVQGSVRLQRLVSGDDNATRESRIVNFLSAGRRGATSGGESVDTIGFGHRAVAER